jgi:Uma2 family endonuclease
VITDINQLDLTKQYTYADYLTWQFAERVELIKGWVYKMSPAPSRLHQRISQIVSSEIYNYVKGGTCEVYSAPFDVRLVNKRKSVDDKEVMDVVQPDICVICDATKLDDRGCIGAPELIIEIISKGNSKRDVQQKFELYQENGVLEYWIIQPNDCTVSVFDLVNQKYVLRKIYSNEDEIEVAVLQGLSIDMKIVFQ